MDKNATSATSDFVNVDAYYESLILNAVAQADAPLHEALVRSNVYRIINDSYERAVARLVIDGELLYANGEYSMAPDAANEVAEPAEEPVATDAIELEAVKSEGAEGENTGDEDVDGAVVDDENVEFEENAPEAVECDVEESEAAEPESAERAVAEPEANEADIVELDADERDTAEPEAVEVAAEEPVTAEPTAGDATEAEAVEPVAEEAEAVESVTPEDPAPMACGPISLRADSTLEQLKVNERSWPIPVVVGVSYDKKPADGLSLMGYELPAESAEVAVERQEPAQVEQQEPVQPERSELTLSSEPQQLVISFSDGLEVAKAVAEPEPEPEPEAEPVEAAVNKLERPRYLSGWDDPRCVFDSETQVAFLDKQNIKDVFSLVRELGKAEDADVRAASETQLRAYALPLSPQYRAQAPKLGKLSGNKKLAFDVFGNLRSIGLECCAYTDAKGPETELFSTIYSGDGEPLSLLNLSISPALQRKLKSKYRIHNLPELLSYNWRELRTKGLTSGELHSIVSALNDWP